LRVGCSLEERQDLRQLKAVMQACPSNMINIRRIFYHQELLMKFEESISVNENIDIIRDRIDVYLKNVGYKNISMQPDMVYERGSLLGTWMSFSPKGWHANASITLIESSDGEINVALNIDVNTSGQIVSAKERDYWNLELENFKKTVLTGSSNLTDVSGSEKETLKENLLIGGLFFIIVFVSTIIANIVLDTRNASMIGAIIGGLLGILIAKQVLKF
jgi:hypothetical protein